MSVYVYYYIFLRIGIYTMLEKMLYPYLSNK